MSDQIKHECGIGLIRLLKPLDYYRKKYGTSLWGLNRMYLLLEKQHNRGQDGAGLACLRLHGDEGTPYMTRKRNNDHMPLASLFAELAEDRDKLERKFPQQKDKPGFLEDHFRFCGELYLGHLRYGTHGDNSIDACHPVMRSNNWRSRSLMVAGNFNLTNVDELFRYLVDMGQHPRFLSDTETVLERIAHFLDEENNRQYEELAHQGLNPADLTRKVAEQLDVRRIMQRAATKWDGGYAMAGLIGSGDAFVARDPSGIRPAYYYASDEVVVVASERPTISTTFNVPYEDIREINPGHVFIIKANGKVEHKPYTEPREKKSCSFERIYFSRGNDPAIYRERLALGDLLVPKILETVQQDLDNTVFSYIPNTAESAFWGMIKGVETWMINQKIEKIKELNGKATNEELERILMARPRVEKAILKDVKLRTFITNDNQRDDMVAHVYDITQGTLNPGKDTLVCIDDSIVRGTTLKQSILRILDRLRPKKIVIVSSAPQIRYPDCYGIDMSQIGRFVAFQAAVALLRERGMESTIHRVYRECQALEEQGLLESRNLVKQIYEPFTEDEISRKVSEIVTPPGISCKVEIVYQPLRNLVRAIPDHRGDWYFSGDFPTPGGNRVTNVAYMKWVEGKDGRAY